VADTLVTPDWRCPICGDVQSRVIVGEVIWRTEIPGPNRYDIVRCCQCDVIAADPMPEPHVLRAYYENYQPTVVDVYRDTKLVEMQSGLWGYLRAFMPSNRQTKVLDYGFGAGAFLKYIAKQGATSFGVDFSEQNISQLTEWCSKQRLNMTLLNASARTTDDLRDERFDLITMLQVVEHLVDPVGTIASLAELQNRGAVLYLECPNQDAWFFRAKNHLRRVLRREFMYGSVSPPQHVLGFNGKSLRMLLRRCGYRVVAVGDYSVADQIHAPENSAWYPTLWQWISYGDKRTALGFGKAIIRLLDMPFSRVLGLGGGLYGLAERL
jgi:2-polyprenyl-3-methyl-5-hydroxy-6-metoxy-1,4-benzoquinol methylase